MTVALMCFEITIELALAFLDLPQRPVRVRSCHICMIKLFCLETDHP